MTIAHRTKLWAGCLIAAGLLFLAFVLLPRRPAGERVIRAGVSPVVPFGHGPIDGRPAGFVVDLVDSAAARRSIRVDWVPIPEGGEAALSSGRIDLYPGMQRTAERSARFYITSPYFRKDFCLVSSVDATVHSPGECLGRRIVWVNGPLTKILAARYLPGVTGSLAASRNEAVLAVCRGEADAAFSEMAFLQSMLLVRPAQCAGFRFHIAPLRGPVIEEGLAVAPRNAALADELRAEIEKLRADGTYARVLANWNPFALSENEILFQEQQQRDRMLLLLALVGSVALIAALLFWQNRRVSRARRLAETANASLSGSVSQLRDAHQRLRFHFDHMPLAYIVWDPDFRVREWNPAAERIFGWPADEAIGKPIGELVLPAPYEERVKEIWERAMAGNERGSTELENVSRAGKPLTCEWISTPLRGDAGGTVGLLSLAQDVSDRKRLEEDLRQSQKLESIGRLAGGVAHDFNNLLTVINGYGDLLLRRLNRDDPSREAVEEMRQAGERAATLTQQLLAFSRKQILQPRPLDLNAEIRANEQMFRRLVGEDIKMVTRLSPALGRVMADAGQIHRVLLNLLANARDAMPTGGTVIVATAGAEVGLDTPGVPSGMKPGPYVELTVTDTGLGMDRATEERIFEPYFTTKGLATAAGLGLPMVHGVVRQSAGSIQVSSEVGKGTTFRILLPRIDDGDGDGEAKIAVAEVPRGSETILVVEDQPDVRGLAASVLRGHGYTVLDADGGDEAVRLVQSHPKPIAMILTDVVMPGMNGREVAAAVARFRPNIRVLYMSGYGEDVIARQGILAPGVDCLAKPFSPAELLQRTHEILHRSPGPPAVSPIGA